MSDEKEKAISEEEKDIKESKKIAVIGYASIGSRLLSNLPAKQASRFKSKGMTLADAMNRMGFVTVQDVELPASQQYDHGYSRRDLKDFTKGNRNLKGRGRK